LVSKGSYAADDRGIPPFRKRRVGHPAKDPADWKWSSFRHYALREVGPVEIESEWTAADRETRTNGGPSRVCLRPVC